ncbi:unnamed protein product [Cylindrotheca closterium]|uniref:Uncharacterized protein n=1 Tax=Cylindrotheca closterium TaxID=2856 RepID=A0AAD2G5T9_9STRA|nr:unnamed protein product [Cylindrotheca closterium]
MRHNFETTEAFAYYHHISSIDIAELFKMKLVAVSLMYLAVANAFAPTRTPSHQRSSSALSAALPQRDNESPEKKFSLGAPVVGLVLGLSIMTSAAFAVELDFSLPSYDAKMSGFGEGTEAILNKKTSDLTDPGANEKTKQSEAAMKAAIALKEKRTKEQEMKKLQYEADKQRAIEKKARDAERLKSIWN